MSDDAVSGPLMRLGQVLDLQDLPSWCWFFVTKTADEITLETACFPQTLDTREMSEVEAERLEQIADEAGLRRFLCRSQLEDIIENLRQQRPKYTRAEVEAAIRFYWLHDAFIVL